MLYNTGDSQHTQNIQIIKLLVKMKYVSFILWKKLNRFFGQYLEGEGSEYQIFRRKIWTYLWSVGKNPRKGTHCWSQVLEGKRIHSRARGGWERGRMLFPLTGGTFWGQEKPSVKRSSWQMTETLRTVGTAVFSWGWGDRDQFGSLRNVDKKNGTAHGRKAVRSQQEITKELPASGPAEVS